MEINYKDKFGSCGLLCVKCFAYKSGSIGFHSSKLKENMGEFGNYAKRFLTLLACIMQEFEYEVIHLVEFE